MSSILTEGTIFASVVELKPTTHTILYKYVYTKKGTYMKKEIEQAVVDGITASPNSMRQAAKIANMPYRTFIERAKKLGMYKPNQSGKGLRKNGSANQLSLISILNGEQPQYQTNLLKQRLLKEGIKQNCCEICGISDWNGLPVVMHLDHMDGDNTNHVLSNLRIVCPNCHSQPDTYAGRNKKIGRKHVSASDFQNVISSSKNIREGLILLGLEPKGANYKRASRLDS